MLTKAAAITETNVSREANRTRTRANALPRQAAKSRTSAGKSKSKQYKGGIT
jgi:hypothetical protein